jgi:nucleoside 2-deoxyribosyltransferase
MDRAIIEISRCAALLIDFSDKPTGRAIEAGIAFAQNKKVISIMKRGTKIKDTVKGISDSIIEYDLIDDIIQPLQKLHNKWKNN